MNRARFALLFGLALVIGACGPAREQWNVLLVTLDTTRADALSCYGAPAGSTPTLDALASAGARFDLAISTAAVTPVAHASILTGLENMEHGLRVLSAGSGYRLSEAHPTLASVLRAAGWRTAAVHSAFPVSAHFGLHHAFDVFESFDGALTRKEKGDVWDVARLQRRSDETTERVLADLARDEEPWLLWIHYWDPHDDVLVPPATELPAHVPRRADGSPEAGRALYAAEVSYVDQQLGRVIAALRANGDLERTVVVVVADHGEGLGDHGWQHHRILYQEQIRVPLLVCIPGMAPRSVPELVRTTDIYPTVLDYLGIEAPRPVSGKTLRPLLDGRGEAPRTAYADQINGFDTNAGLVRARPEDAFLYCVMDREWKLVWRPAAPRRSELYDLVRDPRETQNRFTAEAEQVARLAALLAARNGWVLAPFPTADGGVSTEARAALDGIGYTSDTEPGSEPGAEPEWVWTCAVHLEVALSVRARCPTCRAALLPARPGR